MFLNTAMRASTFSRSSPSIARNSSTVSEEKFPPDEGRGKGNPLKTK